MRELFGARDPGELSAAARGRSSPGPVRAGRVFRTLPRWVPRPSSLRAKITAAFTIVVVGGTAVSTLIGSRIITNALLQQAGARVLQGLDAARMVYAGAMDGVKESVVRVASSNALAEAAAPGSAGELGQALPALGRAAGLDFLAVTAARGPLPGRDRPADAPCLADGVLGALVRGALEGRTVVGTEVLDRRCLLAQNPALAERAYVRIVPVPRAPAGPLTEISSGLALVAAAPVLRNGRIIGAAYGGVLLTRRDLLVDQIQQLVHGDERYGGRRTGTATIFLGDVRVATNVMMESNERAVGTRASADIAQVVLGEGRPWHGRAFVVNDWHVAAYEPLRNYSGRAIGMLYVGTLEAPFLASRTEVMLTFLVVCLIGLVIVFALTYIITRRTISPLEEMVAATKTIADGNLDVSVRVSSHDEIGDLAVAFNDMLASLRTMKTELEQWARTLEEKVKERTEVLVAVQSQMAQSEKLASVGRLAAGVAHSINNPLGGILSLSMLALEDCDAAHPLRGDLETIVKQTERCREIVKGLLDFSRQSNARVESTDVNAVVDSALSMLQRQAVFQNIKVVRNAQAEVPAVLIDPGQLQEVVTCLVLNAIDAMEESGTLTVDTAAEPDLPEVIIHVSDTGQGIPPEAMPFIFEPFFTTKRVGQGTGLGLAIVHGIVTRAGGRVEVASSPKGATFTVRLPVSREEAGDGAAEVAGGRARESAAGR